MEDRIKRFLFTAGNGYSDSGGSGAGSGSGNGSGNGSGSGGCGGNGSGAGSGSGDGSGTGDGCGYWDGSGVGVGVGDGDGAGYGDGEGNCEFKARGYKTDYKAILIKLKGQDVAYVDNIPCIFFSVKGNIARVGIIRDDFSLKSAFIAKYNNFFAHGETAREALRDAENKYISSRSFEEIVAAFKAEVSPTKHYPVRYFSDWHGRLTGSCKLGRIDFAKAHSLDLDKDKISLNEFFDLVRSSYGAEKIKQVESLLSNIK
jgi:hypothetical protein